jgi:hypothetical protein
MDAPRFRRAAQIAGGVEDQTSVRSISPEVVIHKDVQHLLPPTSARCGFQLEDHTAVLMLVATAASFRCAVEIASGIEDQAGSEKGPAGVVVAEAKQNCLRPRSESTGWGNDHQR